MIWTRTFWVAAAERAISTFAQVLAALLIAGEPMGLHEADWLGCLSIAGMAALLSVLKAVAANTARNPGPSAVNAETLKPRF